MNILLVLLISVFSCNTEMPTQFSEEALNDKFVTLNGNEVSFESILEKYKGKTIVIDVWASWCGDCLRGMPKVKELQNEYKDVVYVFLSLDRGQDAWKKGIEKYNVEGDHYYMQSGWKGPFGNFLNLDWIPRYLVVNKASEIVVFKVIEANDKKLIQALKK
ncbi:TlpA family protein disulfide reductase [Seonamhaeicola sediminis]|uniref:TlpA family protein disulfide reductase n=1 Tax=Seonamhaeicola sediminis TaxID=2528206 RepID=A0A562YE61_9FLAO|nr:TlpA disulfide reductase family protein [Seonamhaeicola sediminis]TWO32603.1 TlpA family protein disulfide reductase [Seonamhaeicola sediminis]